MEGEKLRYSLKKPFDLFVKCTDFEKWQGLVDRFRTDPDMRLLVVTTIPYRKAA